MERIDHTRRTALKLLGLGVGATAGTTVASAQDESSSDEDVDVSDLWVAHLEPQGDVESDARGFAAFQYRDGEITFALAVSQIEDVFMAHIHEDEVLGPIAVWLHDFETRDEELVEGTFSGLLDAGTITDDAVAEGSAPEAEADDVDGLLEKIEAGEAYVNVHTEEYPGGVIAGPIESFEWNDLHMK